MQGLSDHPRPRYNTILEFGAIEFRGGSLYIRYSAGHQQLQHTPKRVVEGKSPELEFVCGKHAANPSLSEGIVVLTPLKSCVVRL